MGINKNSLPFCTGDHFMLSTVSSKNEAHLLVYRVIQGTGNDILTTEWWSFQTLLLFLSTDYDKIYEAKLDRTLKKFTSKPINQLAVIPEHHIFLALACEYCIYYALYEFVS